MAFFFARIHGATFVMCQSDVNEVCVSFNPSFLSIEKQIIGAQSSENKINKYGAHFMTSLRAVSQSGCFVTFV